MFHPYQSGRGFTLIEILVTISIIILLSFIGLESYVQYVAFGHDAHRTLDLNTFSQKLETYKNEFGFYTCGDRCAQAPSPSTEYYTIDCSDTTGAIVGNDPDKISGFLNGGDCCNLNPITVSGTNVNHGFGGFPTPSTTNDNLSWGLFRSKYLANVAPHDPIERVVQGKQYTYCYAAPAQGRNSFALFARLESSDAAVKDGGLCSAWYEVKSSNYPANGWVPPACN